MTKEPPDEFQDNDRAEEENEEELDDNDYVPRFIQKVLDNPELLPREIRADFVSVFEDFEYTHHGRAKTALEYIMVS
jgi:hypothetical protein